MFALLRKVKKIFLPIDIQLQLFDVLVAAKFAGMKVAQNSNSYNYVFVNTF